MVDSFYRTKSTRRSPENQKIKIVVPQNEQLIVGGAGNVAANLRGLGAKVDLDGVVGCDQYANFLFKQFKMLGIQYHRICSEQSILTTLKKRFFIDDSEVFRLDIEEYFEKKYIKTDQEYDVVIISDYNKGVINKSSMKSIINNFKKHVTVVDPKKDNFEIYKGAKILTPNLNELKKATNASLESNQSIEDCCMRLIERFNFKYIVLTKGKRGISVVGKEIKKHYPAYEVYKPDVVGAGDTVVASLSLAYTKTNNIDFSTRVANLAASIAVSKKSTSIVKIQELLDKIEKIGVNL